MLLALRYINQKVKYNNLEEIFLTSNSSKPLNYKFYYNSLLSIFTEYLFVDKDVDTLFKDNTESYSIYRCMNNQIWQNFFKGGKFSKNLENLNVGESIRCPLFFLSTSIDESVAISFTWSWWCIF